MQGTGKSRQAGRSMERGDQSAQQLGALVGWALWCSGLGWMDGGMDAKRGMKAENKAGLRKS